MKLNYEDIDIVILCGGLGSRLKAVLNNKPKALASIKGTPFSDILIKYLYGFGFNRFILCTGYKSKQIRQYYNKNNALKLKILFSEEKKALGTGGAIKHAEDKIKSNPFIVLNGDSYCKINFHKFLNFHFKKQGLLSICIKKYKENKACGVVQINSQQKIMSFNEKISIALSAGFISAGAYILDRQVLDCMPPEGVNFSLEYDFFPNFITKGAFGYKTRMKFIDIGTPENYEYAKKNPCLFNL